MMQPWKATRSSLLNLLQEDALLLDRFITGRYPETLLHVASMLGHLKFVDEILTSNPELAKELDSQKSSPLHLAAAKGYLQVAKSLLQVNPDMCLVSDIDGRNPIHIAAMKGHLGLLRELVDARPWAARAINFLISSTTIDVDCVNEDGFAALDLLSQNQKDVFNKEIVESLKRMGSTHAQDKPLSNSQLKEIRTKIFLSDWDQSNATSKSKKRKDGNRFSMWCLMVIMWVAITAMALAYLVCLVALTPDHQGSLPIITIILATLVWIGLMLILFLGHTIRLIVRLMKCIFTRPA
ncbi:putative Gag-pol polyprotein [Hibiscus syriacus]|uniref:Gag-pol polyprotein n=1 Tax=Hibiscus syriacus TaxID=106335 RepID=A0A6A2ZDJ0_HIBSY|nr:putative Gag-pol polyprotein [Hibiscus syriacus]